MNQNPYLDLLILDLIAVFGCTFLVISQLIQKQPWKRARWARALLITTGIVGIVSFAGDFAVKFHPFITNRDLGLKLYRIRILINGCMVGWFIALAFAGELRGKRRPPDQSSPVPSP